MNISVDFEYDENNLYLLIINAIFLYDDSLLYVLILLMVIENVCGDLHFLIVSLKRKEGINRNL